MAAELLKLARCKLCGDEMKANKKMRHLAESHPDSLAVLRIKVCPLCGRGPIVTAEDLFMTYLEGKKIKFRYCKGCFAYLGIVKGAA